MYESDTYEKVSCRICGHKLQHLAMHIMRSHGYSMELYKELYPGAPILSQMFRDNLKGDKNPSKLEEVKAKKSKALMGDKNPMYGKKHTEETRKKMSEKQLEIGVGRGKPMPEHIKKKFLEARKQAVGEKHHFYGKHHTEETKRLLSAKCSERLSKGGQTSISGIELICKSWIS